MKLLDKILAMPHGDKIAHALGGAVVGLATVLAGFPQYATAAAIVVGVGKEVVDMGKEGNKFDPLDLGATVSGGIVVQILYFLTVNNFVA